MRTASHRLGRGSILVTTLWIIALLSLMAFGLVTRVRLGARQARWSSSELEARQLLSALGGLCISRLRSDTDPDVDSLRETWAYPFEKSSDVLLSEFENAGSVTRSFRISVMPADECGKVNVNFASTELLVEVLREAGVRSNASDLAEAIVDWRDADNEGLAESDVYATLSPAYEPSNADLVRLEELLFVQGINPTLFFGEDANHDRRLDSEEDDGDMFLPADNADGRLQLGLVDMFTVYGDGTINVNSASESVLRSALSAAIDEGEAERLAGDLVAHRHGAGGFDAGDHIRPFTTYEEIAEVLGENVLDRCAGIGIEFDVISSAFRFYLRVAMPEDHLYMDADMVVVRDGDELQVTEWHDS